MTAEEFIEKEYGESWLKNDWSPGDVQDALAEYGKHCAENAFDVIQPAVSGSDLPKCHYCGQFVNPNKGGVKMAAQYGFMGIDYDYYYHEKCARGTERL